MHWQLRHDERNILHWHVRCIQVAIIVLVIGLTLGFDVYALKYYWSDDYTMWLPRNGGTTP